MTPASLQLDYVSSDELATQSASWWRNVLGVVGFEKPPTIELMGVPVTASMTPSLGITDGLCEVWRVPETANSRPGRCDRAGLHFRYCDELLFGSITIDEEGLDGKSAAGLLPATMTAYQEIFDVVDTPHRHLIRVWELPAGDQWRGRWGRALSALQFGAAIGVPAIGPKHRRDGARGEAP